MPIINFSEWMTFNPDNPPHIPEGGIYIWGVRWEGFDHGKTIMPCYIGDVGENIGKTIGKRHYPGLEIDIQFPFLLSHQLI